MLICVILLLYTFNTAFPKDLNPTTTHQKIVRFSEPPIPLNSYPYQEDLTSSVQFLKDETTNKKSKVGELIKVLKKVLDKYVNDLKENEQKPENKLSIELIGDLEEDKKDLNENNTIFETTEQIVVKEFKKDNEVVKEIKCEKVMEEIYEVGNRVFNSHKLQENNYKVSYNPEERIETTTVAKIEEFAEDDQLTYMRNFRPKPICYQKQQESYVLERPEPILTEKDSPIPEKSEKIVQSVQNQQRKRKNKQRKRSKKQEFIIPCVKASDVLEDTTKYVPKEAYSDANIRPKVNSDVKEIQTTLENPLTNYITCSDSDDTVAMLFKPKTISLMQAYGNLLKKITVTVLVPFHVTKLVL